MNERDRLLRKSRRSKNELDISKYKQKRNEVNIALRRAKSSYHKDLIHEHSGNSNKLWKTLKSIYPIKSKGINQPRTLELNGIRLNDSYAIANAFASFFKNIIVSLKAKTIPLIDFVWKMPTNISKRTDSIFKFHPVTSSEVECLLKAIKKSKATGIDDLPPRLLKDSAPIISVPLTHIINMSLGSGVFPREWKSAKIMPIHKTGSMSSFDNYRPISILPVISKIAEKIVHKQLIHYLGENKLLSPLQFGFQPGMSTELAATKLLDDIRRYVDGGCMVGATFIDLSKAFDTISHPKLLAKLPQYGIRDEEHSWFIDYLFHRTARVSFDGCLSDMQPIL